MTLLPRLKRKVKTDGLRKSSLVLSNTEFRALLYPVNFVTIFLLARSNRLSHCCFQVRTNGGKRRTTTATATAALDRHGPAASRRPDPPGLLLVLRRPRHVRGVEGGRRGRPQGGGRGTSRRRRGTSRRRGCHWRPPQRRRLRVRPGGVHLGAARAQAGPGEKIRFNRIVGKESNQINWK